MARKTWRFFDELVGPADHWLVPDNYQENRHELVAHRTSPTNIGLQLLSVLAAHDFGYLTRGGVLDRLEPTFATLLALQRFAGISTTGTTPARSRRSHRPTSRAWTAATWQAISLTMRGGMTTLMAAPLFDRRIMAAVADMSALCDEQIRRMAARHGAGRSDYVAVRKALGALRTDLDLPVVAAGVGSRAAAAR